MSINWKGGFHAVRWVVLEPDFPEINFEIYFNKNSIVTILVMKAMLKLNALIPL